jgi:prophage regulatory protein
MKILRLKQVTAMTGLARSTIYKYVSAGTFPEPIPLGGRSVGWIEAELHQWITERIENRDIHNHPMNRNSVA